MKPAKYKPGMYVRAIGALGPSRITACRHSRQFGWWYRLSESYGGTVDVYEDQILGVTFPEWEDRDV